MVFLGKHAYTTVQNAGSQNLISQSIADEHQHIKQH